MPETGESIKIPVAGPVCVVLLTEAVAVELDDEVVSWFFSLPPSQAVKLAINAAGRTVSQESFVNG